MKFVEAVEEMRSRALRRKSWQGRTIRPTRVRAEPAMNSAMVVDLPENSIGHCTDEAMCPKTETPRLLTDRGWVSKKMIRELDTQSEAESSR